jgi:hypothetical protein
MNLLRNFFKGIDIKNAVASAMAGILLLVLFTWLSRDHWKVFFNIHTITLNISLARFLLGLILVIIFAIFVSVYIAKYRTLEIISAKYGVDRNYVDVTPQLKDIVSRNKINYLLTNGITGGLDPAEHIHKHAIINYKYGNQVTKITVSENDRIIIPN